MFQGFLPRLGYSELRNLNAGLFVEPLGEDVSVAEVTRLLETAQSDVHSSARPFKVLDERPSVYQS